MLHPLLRMLVSSRVFRLIQFYSLSNLHENSTAFETRRNLSWFHVYVNGKMVWCCLRVLFVFIFLKCTYLCLRCHIFFMHTNNRNFIFESRTKPQHMMTVIFFGLNFQCFNRNTQTHTKKNNCKWKLPQVVLFTLQMHCIMHWISKMISHFNMVGVSMSWLTSKSFQAFGIRSKYQYS